MSEAEAPQWEAAFVRRVERQRKAEGLSQTEVARRMTARGVKFHQQQVDRLETGRRAVRLNEAIVLCEVLGVDFAEFTTASDVAREHAYLRDLNAAVDAANALVEACAAYNETVRVYRAWEGHAPGSHDPMPTAEVVWEFYTVGSTGSDESAESEGMLDPELVRYLQRSPRAAERELEAGEARVEAVDMLRHLQRSSGAAKDSSTAKGARESEAVTGDVKR